MPYDRSSATLFRCPFFNRPACFWPLIKNLMMKNSLAAFLLIGMAFFSGAFAQLDKTFDGDGMRLISFSASGTTKDMAVQADNKIVIIGNCNEIGTLRAFCVIRLNEDGSFDTSFGNGSGFVFAPLNGPTPTFGRQGVVIQNDGKIVLVGTVSSALTLVRLNPDGSLDTTFGTNGSVQNAAVSQANKIAIQPDGKLVVIGFSGSTASDAKQTVARFLPSGAPDTAFGTNGITTLTFGLARSIGTSLDIQPDGRIVTGGALATQATAYLLARLNRNGTLDTTFDNDGYLFIDSGANLFPELGNLISVKVKSDGRIVALGDRNILFSFYANGSPDLTFDGDGSRTALANSEVYDMAVSTSGRIIVAGNPTIPEHFPNIDYRSAAYLADGSPDLNYTGVNANSGGIDGATAALFDRKGRVTLSGRSSFGAIRNAPWINPIFSAARYVAPAPQTVGFSGRVTELNGASVQNAVITLKSGSEIIAYARTNPFGYFYFQNIATNQTYTIATAAKGKFFYDRSVMIDAATANFLIVGERTAQ